MTHRGNFPYESLDVYHRAVAFDTFAAGIVSGCSRSHAFVDHLDRASESMVNGLVCGSAKWSAAAKCRHYGIAYGSALECAGCLDIGRTRSAIVSEECCRGKTDLQHVVRMLVGLIRAVQSEPEVREAPAEYTCRNRRRIDEQYFDHESLYGYRRALDFVGWADALVRKVDISSRLAKRLDRLSTSTVLNIAEGNGRFGREDHRSFLDTAYLSALKAASLLDRMRGREIIESNHCAEGKALLDDVARLVFGMKRYLDQDELQ